MEDNKSKLILDSEVQIQERVIQIDRVNKVVSGGKRMSFRAVVISGNLNGSAGIGLGKSKEVPISIKKAVERAKRSFVAINILNGTLPHAVDGKYGASRVIIKPARPGTGVIAGGSVRILLELLGFKDVVAKSMGSNNSVNSARAALNALKKCKNIEAESKLRGKVFKLRHFNSLLNSAGDR